MIDVEASPTNSQRNDRCARKPATAGPAATPAFTAKRYMANPVMRRPSGVRSAIRAADAGRYNSAVNPASTVSDTIRPMPVACDSASIVVADENIDSAILFRRPMVSANCPPASAAAMLPIPYALNARPAAAGE